MVPALDREVMIEKEPVVIGWDESRDHLIKMNAVNILKNEGIKRINVLPVKVRIKSQMRVIEGWAFLTHSKCCIVIISKKHVADTKSSNGTIGISVWKSILVFRNNPYFDEVAVFPDNPMTFEWKTKILAPFQEQ